MAYDDRAPGDERFVRLDGNMTSARRGAELTADRLFARYGMEAGGIYDARRRWSPEVSMVIESHEGDIESGSNEKEIRQGLLDGFIRDGVKPLKGTEQAIAKLD